MQLRAFFNNLAHIFGTNEQIFMKILSQMYLWTRKALLHLGSHPDLHQIRLGRDLHFPRARFLNFRVESLWTASYSRQT